MVLGYRPSWACPAPVHRSSATPTSAQAAKTPTSKPAAGGSCLGLGHQLPDISFLPDDDAVSPPTSPPAPPTPGAEIPPNEVFQFTFAGHPPRAAAPAMLHGKDCDEEPRTRRKSAPTIAQQNAEYYAQQKQRPTGLGYRPSCAFPSMRSFVSKCFEAADEPFMIGVESAPDSPPPSLPASPVHLHPTSSLYTLTPHPASQLPPRPGGAENSPPTALLPVAPARFIPPWSPPYPLSTPLLHALPSSQPSDETKEHFNAFAADEFRLPAQYRPPARTQAALPLPLPAAPALRPSPDPNPDKTSP